MLQWSRLDWIYVKWVCQDPIAFEEPLFICFDIVVVHSQIFFESKQSSPWAFWKLPVLVWIVDDWKATFFKECRCYHNTYLLTLTWCVQRIFCFYPRQSLLQFCFISFLICSFAYSCSNQLKGVMGANAAQHEVTKLIKWNIQVTRINQGCFKTSWKLDWSEEKGKVICFLFTQNEQQGGGLYTTSDFEAPLCAIHIRFDAMLWPYAHFCT